jgi:hypothetical protein
MLLASGWGHLGKQHKILNAKAQRGIQRKEK